MNEGQVNGLGDIINRIRKEYVAKYGDNLPPFVEYPQPDGSILRAPDYRIPDSMKDKLFGKGDSK